MLVLALTTVNNADILDMRYITFPSKIRISKMNDFYDIKKKKDDRGLTAKKED